MAPLTSPHCDSCLHKTQKIAELEKRISNLVWIRNEETLLDSVVVLGAGPPDVTAELDSTAPVQSVGSSVAAVPVPAGVTPAGRLTSAPRSQTAGAAATATSKPASAVENPHCLTEDTYALLGARPKWAKKCERVPFNFSPNPRLLANSSTPSHQSWSTVHRSGLAKLSCTPCELKLNNRYDILSVEEFPPLQPGFSPPPVCPVSVPLPADEEAGVTAEAVSSPRPHPAASPEQRCLPPRPRPLFPPTTAIIGDSITRKIRFFNSATHCFPGATVHKITDKLPGLFQTFPHSVERLIIHVGTNDVTKRQSELLKGDFNTLFAALKDCGKTIFFSGPLPTLGRGAERFSRILQLHSWLKAACNIHGFHFIDNFNLFWNRASFYHHDGLHPSSLGSRTLAANIQYTVINTPVSHA